MLLLGRLSDQALVMGSCWFFLYEQKNPSPEIQKIQLISKNCSATIKEVLNGHFIPQLISRLGNGAASVELIFNLPGNDNYCILCLLGMCWWMQSMVMDQIHDQTADLCRISCAAGVWVMYCRLASAPEWIQISASWLLFVLALLLEAWSKAVSFWLVSSFLFCWSPSLLGI